MAGPGVPASVSVLVLVLFVLTWGTGRVTGVQTPSYEKPLDSLEPASTFLFSFLAQGRPVDTIGIRYQRLQVGLEPARDDVVRYGLVQQAFDFVHHDYFVGSQEETTSLYFHLSPGTDPLDHETPVVRTSNNGTLNVELDGTLIQTGSLTDTTSELDVSYVCHRNGLVTVELSLPLGGKRPYTLILTWDKLCDDTDDGEDFNATRAAMELDQYRHRRSNSPDDECPEDDGTVLAAHEGLPTPSALQRTNASTRALPDEEYWTHRVNHHTPNSAMAMGFAVGTSEGATDVVKDGRPLPAYHSGHKMFDIPQNEATFHIWAEESGQYEAPMVVVDKPFLEYRVTGIGALGGELGPGACDKSMRIAFVCHSTGNATVTVTMDVMNDEGSAPDSVAFRFTKSCASVHCPALSCHHHGYCDADGVCVCDQGWEGSTCGTMACPNGCSGHGACENGACLCAHGWDGIDCSMGLCLNNCTGPSHGYCWLGSCLCYPGWSGEDCSAVGCPKNCLGRGTCVNGVCSCATPFYGFDCSLGSSFSLRIGTRKGASDVLAENKKGTHGPHSVNIPAGVHQSSFFFTTSMEEMRVITMRLHVDTPAILRVATTGNIGSNMTLDGRENVTKALKLVYRCLATGHGVVRLSLKVTDESTGEDRRITFTVNKTCSVCHASTAVTGFNIGTRPGLFNVIHNGLPALLFNPAEPLAGDSKVVTRERELHATEDRVHRIADVEDHVRTVQFPGHADQDPSALYVKGYDPHWDIHIPEVDHSREDPLMLAVVVGQHSPLNEPLPPDQRVGQPSRRAGEDVKEWSGDQGRTSLAPQDPSRHRRSSVTDKAEYSYALLPSELPEEEGHEEAYHHPENVALRQVDDAVQQGHAILNPLTHPPEASHVHDDAPTPDVSHGWGEEKSRDVHHAVREVERAAREVEHVLGELSEATDAYKRTQKGCGCVTPVNETGPTHSSTESEEEEEEKEEKPDKPEGSEGSENATTRFEEGNGSVHSANETTTATNTTDSETPKTSASQQRKETVRQRIAREKAENATNPVEVTSGLTNTTTTTNTTETEASTSELGVNAAAAEPEPKASATEAKVNTTETEASTSGLDVNAAESKANATEPETNTTEPETSTTEPETSATEPEAVTEADTTEVVMAKENVTEAETRVERPSVDAEAHLLLKNISNNVTALKNLFPMSKEPEESITVIDGQFDTVEHVDPDVKVAVEAQAVTHGQHPHHAPQRNVSLPHFEQPDPQEVKVVFEEAMNVTYWMTLRRGFGAVVIGRSLVELEDPRILDVELRGNATTLTILTDDAPLEFSVFFLCKKRGVSAVIIFIEVDDVPLSFQIVKTCIPTRPALMVGTSTGDDDVMSLGTAGPLFNVENRGELDVYRAPPEEHHTHFYFWASQLGINSTFEFFPPQCRVANPAITSVALTGSAAQGNVVRVGDKTAPVLQVDYRCQASGVTELVMSIPYLKSTVQEEREGSSKEDTSRERDYLTFSWIKRCGSIARRGLYVGRTVSTSEVVYNGHTLTRWSSGGVTIAPTERRSKFFVWLGPGESAQNLSVPIATSSDHHVLTPHVHGDVLQRCTVTPGHPVEFNVVYDCFTKGSATVDVHINVPGSAPIMLSYEKTCAQQDEPDDQRMPPGAIVGLAVSLSVVGFLISGFLFKKMVLGKTGTDAIPFASAFRNDSA